MGTIAATICTGSRPCPVQQNLEGRSQGYFLDLCTTCMQGGVTSVDGTCPLHEPRSCPVHPRHAVRVLRVRVFKGAKALMVEYEKARKTICSACYVKPRRTSMSPIYRRRLAPRHAQHDVRGVQKVNS